MRALGYEEYGMHEVLGLIKVVDLMHFKLRRGVIGELGYVH